MKKKIIETVKEYKLEKIIEYDYSIKEKTTYKTGGIADYYILIQNKKDAINSIKFINHLKLPCFILGNGSNILFSDKRFKGVVLDTSKLNKYKIENNILKAQCGVITSQIAKESANLGLAGLDAFYYMPGFLGGGLYMNSKAYGVEFSDMFLEATYIDIKEEKIKTFKMQDCIDKFAYKKSPFQDNNKFIFNMKLQLKPQNRSILLQNIEDHKNDRIKKEQFSFPSCGCIFKNDRKIGISTGKLIENLGLKKYQIGNAQVASFHANFIINKENALSSDIKKLIHYIKKKAYEAKKINLEEEVIYVGEFDD